MKAHANILVTGATGFVGRALVMHYTAPIFSTFLSRQSHTKNLASYLFNFCNFPVIVVEAVIPL